MTALERALCHLGEPSWSLQDGREMYDACLDEIGDEIGRPIGMRLKLIRPGKYRMGSDSPGYHRTVKKPVPEVTIAWPFFLGVCEVTQAEFEALMGYNPSYFCDKARGKEGGDYSGGRPGGGADRVEGLDTSSFPVELVSSVEALEFCERLTEQTPGGLPLRFRLPTEAEWEYACREGKDGQGPFSFGDSLTSHQANFDGARPYRVSTRGPNLRRTARVGSYEPNALGLFDMHGNVHEWCYGRHPEYDRRSPLKDDDAAPHEPPRDWPIVVRGGSWNDPGWACRSARQHYILDGGGSPMVGFRVAAVPAR